MPLVIELSRDQRSHGDIGQYHRLLWFTFIFMYCDL